jgi:UDP-N-acetylmuramoyl-L-alanyl-D-glutamate--2,6-diaminopimelate ligase
MKKLKKRKVKADRMKISEIIQNSGVSINSVGGFNDSEIISIEYDSRKGIEGSLFAAVEGFESDGHSFIESAVDKGCRCILISEKRSDEFARFADRGVVILVSNDTRRALSAVSSAFYGNPSGKLHVTGITGTNGKTSITYLLEAVYASQGISCGVIGTVNYRWKGKTLPAPNTTPESKDIQELLKTMLDDGVTHVIMEVSSHALELNRVDDIEFDSAIFTNLTVDHLDFHKTIDAYFNAKRRLFDLMEKSPKKNRTAVVNIDDEYGRKLYSEKSKYSYSIKSFGTTGDGDFKAIGNSIDNRITGVRYRLSCDAASYNVELKLAGRFQVYNSLAAFASAYYSGINREAVIRGLGSLKAVPGRLQVVESKLGFYAVVDYAHTGDALLKLLQSINEMPHNRVIAVFGCGGDRDKTKRPVMGKIAFDNSDIAIVTSDNPRTEDPEQIIKDITAGMGDGDYVVEPDRELAIALAVQKASSGDIVVLAGKGHEDYQIIGKTKRHFDDCEMAAKYMREREKVEGII